MTHFVLVHGAFHNATCWNDLIPELETLGHTAEALDLPSHGKDETPIETVVLETYAHKVVDHVKKLDKPFVLVGHSMGGMVITQAADTLIAEGVEPEKLVYVAAFVPKNGQSLVDLAGQPEGAGDMVQANVQVEGEPPVGRMPLDKAKEAFYGDCTDDVADAALKRLDPQPILAFVMPATITDDRKIDRRYVLTTKDKAIPPALQKKMSTDTSFTEVVEIASDHSPFLSHPKELAKIMNSFVSS